jgi:TetR/AcrR family transcriptional regulator, transcriptional repressor for nem operon
MGLFRELGFHGVSADVLVKRLGISRHSLYAEFGSMQGLFEAAVERYDQVVVERNFGPLERSGSGVAEIKALLEFFGAAHAGPASGRGCLLCNTAVEFGAADPSGQGFVKRYFARVSSAFEAALAYSRANGDLRQDVDPQVEAAFFTSTTVGMFVMLRAKVPAEVIQAAAEGAIAHLERLGAKIDGAETGWRSDGL